MNNFTKTIIASLSWILTATTTLAAAGLPQVFTQLNDPLVADRNWESEQNVEAGDILDVLVTVINNDNDAATNVRIVDSLPAELEYVPGSTQKWESSDVAWVAVPDGGAFPFTAPGYNAPDLAIGDWAFYTYQVQVVSPLVSNTTATISYSGAQVQCDGGTSLTPEVTIRDYPNYAWSENGGWLQMKPSSVGLSGEEIFKVYGTGAVGYIWGENVGWVLLANTDTPPAAAAQTKDSYGILNNGNGLLSGYAWSENGGWLTFNSALSQVQIDKNGYFNGYMWAENLGWISANELTIGADIAARVTSNWKPQGAQILAQPAGRITQDSDDNCKIDRIKMTADVALNDNFGDFVANVSGYTVTGYATDLANDAVFYITVAEQAQCDTDATPKVAIVNNTTLANNNDSIDLLQPDTFDAAENLTWGVNAADGVTPRIAARETADLDNDGVLDAVHLIFTENINDATVQATMFEVTTSADVPHNGIGWQTGGTPDDNEIYVTYTPTGENTAQTTKIKYTGGANPIEDMRGNQLPSDPALVATVDAVHPLIISAFEYNVRPGGATDDDVDEIALKWSEPMSDATINSAAVVDQFTFAGCAGSICMNQFGDALVPNGQQLNTAHGNPGEVDPQVANDEWITILTDDDTIDGTDLKALAFTGAAATFQGFGGSQLFAVTQPDANPVDRATPGLASDSLHTLDVNHDGHLDHVQVDFSEPMDFATFQNDEWQAINSGSSIIYGAGGTDYVAIDLTMANTGAIVYLQFDEKADYDTSRLLDVITGATQSFADLAGNKFPTNVDTRNMSEAILNRVDNAAPVIYQSETGDTDHDGHLDRIILTLSENVDVVDMSGATAGFDAVTVADYTIGDKDYAAVDTGTLILDLAPHVDYDTANTPAISYSSGAAAFILDRNNSANVAVTSGAIALTSLDKSGPVMVTATGSDLSAPGMFNADGEYLDLVFSEALAAAVAANDFQDDVTFAGTQVDGAAVTNGLNLPLGVTGTLLTTSTGNDTMRFTRSNAGEANINIISASGATTIQVTAGGNAGLTDLVGNLVATNPAPLAITGDAPVVKNQTGAIATADTDHDGRLDQIEIEFDMPLENTTLNAADFTVAGVVATGAALTNGNQNILLGINVPATNLDTAQTPVIVYTSGSLRGQNGNLVASFQSGSGDVPATADEADPVVMSRETADENHNGQIDHINLIFSEDLAGDASDITATVAGFTVSGYQSGSTAAQVSITIDESGTPDTADTPAVQFTGTGSLTDLVGNPAWAEAAATAAQDKAAPAPVARWTKDLDSDGQIDHIDIQFSEAVNDSNLDTIVFTTTGFTNSGSTTTGETPLDAWVRSPIAESGTPDTAARPDVQLTTVNGTFGDALSNITVVESAAHQSDDGAGAAIVSAGTTGTGTVAVTLSENIDPTTLDTSDFGLTIAGTPRGISTAIAAGNIVTLTSSTEWLGGSQGFVLFSNVNVIGDLASPQQWNSQFTAIDVTDNTSPQINSAATADTDYDGQIDRIVLNFNKQMDTATSSFTGFTVTNYAVSGDAGWSNSDQTFTLTLTESGAPDTGVTPQILYNSGAGLLDINGAVLLDVGPGELTATDAADPIVTLAQSSQSLSGSNILDGTQITVQFSENVTVDAPATTDITVWSGATAIDWDTGSAIALAQGGADEMTIGFTGDTTSGEWITAAKLNLSGAVATITDSAGNSAHLGATAVQIFGLADNIIISEIMNNPAKVPDADGEYFEVYNPTTAPIDMNGWVITDGAAESHTINNGGALEVPALGYLVLGINADKSTNGGVNVDYQYSGFQLTNDSDTIILMNGAEEVDRVEYDDGGTFPDPEGASMYLIDLLSDNNVGANWSTSTTPIEGVLGNDDGTPGYTNHDTTAPTVLLSTATPAQDSLGVFAKEVSVQYEDNEGGSGIAHSVIQIDGGAVSGATSYETGSQAMTGAIIFTADSVLSAGSHTAQVTVTDRTGNQSVQNWTFYLDDLELTVDNTAVDYEFVTNYDQNATRQVSVQTYGAAYGIYAVMPAPLTGALGTIPNITDGSGWNNSTADQAGFGERRTDSTPDQNPTAALWSGFQNNVEKLVAQMPARDPALGAKTDTYDINLRALIDGDIIQRGNSSYTSDVQFIIKPIY